MAARDLVLQREMSSSRGRSARPTGGPGLAVDQLRGDAHAVARGAHAALEHVADTQLRAFATSTTLPLKAKAGCGRSHASSDLREVRDDVFGYAVEKYSCSASPLMLLNGKYGDGGFVRNGRQRRRSCRRVSLR